MRAPISHGEPVTIDSWRIQFRLVVVNGNYEIGDAPGMIENGELHASGRAVGVCYKSAKLWNVLPKSYYMNSIGGADEKVECE